MKPTHQLSTAHPTNGALSAPVFLRGHLSPRHQLFTIPSHCQFRLGIPQIADRNQRELAWLATPGRAVASDEMHRPKIECQHAPARPRLSRPRTRGGSRAVESSLNQLKRESNTAQAHYLTCGKCHLDDRSGDHTSSRCHFQSP